MRRDIVMLMEEIGGGHRMPAFAVRDSIMAIDPAWGEIPVLDLARESGAHEDSVDLKESWNWMLEHPEFTRLANVMMNVLPDASRVLWRLRYTDYYERGMSYLLERRPSLVFSTYFVSTIIAADARERHGLEMRIVSLDTDPFDAHTMWLEPRVDSLIVCSHEARRTAIRRGFPAERLRVFPFPVNPRFMDVKRTRAEVRAELGLDGERVTLLATAGGMGRGVMADYVKAAYAERLPLDIVFVCGRNAGLAEELAAAFDPAAPTRVRVLGFVNNMNELLRASDVLVAKAGASTTFEGLLSRTPILYTDWAAYNEKPNMDFVLRHGAGWFVGSEREFLHLARQIASGGPVAEARRRLAGLHVRSGAEDIARYLMREASC